MGIGIGPGGRTSFYPKVHDISNKELMQIQQIPTRLFLTWSRITGQIMMILSKRVAFTLAVEYQVCTKNSV